ncbi:MAG: hypothetical protein A7316_10035 [Candidatus Altiarchaeales archaeon WOR_SM1_86-2]|nr:MAG: hypothetical protein A7316_10035 [Candidatus Altiarchaeales archaeon WOR_SM1_86-2]
MYNLSIIKDLFGPAKDIRDIINDINKERILARGIKNRVLNEIEFNTELILVHYLKKGADVEKIIEKLKIENLSKAIDDGFDFKKIKRGKIDKNMIVGIGFFKDYVGYDCEAILKKIRFHIEQIKLLPELYDLKKTDKIDVKRRLENLGKRYILFTKFLKSKQ